jgi:predicted DNA-binding antitoxin AbrB/MazE fold protein
MLHTVKAIYKEGKFQLLEDIDISEGTEALVTLLPNNESDFWLGTSQRSLDAIWDNEEDDIYAKLLEA